MAESIDTSDNSPNTESGKVPANSTPGTENIATKHETQNMETHAPHLHHNSGKKFWHYFYEFLMLFLAVFCGFLAENQREHMVEHKREKQFMQSLFNDIKADTVNLERIINARTAKGHALDSLSNMMNSDSVEYFAQRIYFYAVSISRTLPYRLVPNDGTIQQLKNSGAFRLIRQRAVVDSIAKYDVNLRNLLGQWEVEEKLIDHYRDAAINIFDALVFDSMLDENATVTRPPAGNPIMLPYTKRELYQWNYRLYGVKTINKANRRDSRLLLKQAENLLVTIKNEYHLR